MSRSDQSQWWFPDSAKTPFTVMNKVMDVDTTWYTLEIREHEIKEWVYSLPSGNWRYTPSSIMQFCFDYYDVTEEYYLWLVLKWAK